MCDWDLEREQHCTGCITTPYRCFGYSEPTILISIQFPSLRSSAATRNGPRTAWPPPQGPDRARRAKGVARIFSLYTSSYPRHGIESLILAFHGVMIFDHCVPVFIFPLSSYFSSLCIHAKAANQQLGLPLTEHCLPPSSGDSLRFFGTLLDFLYKRSGGSFSTHWTGVKGSSCYFFGFATSWSVG